MTVENPYQSASPKTWRFVEEGLDARILLSVTTEETWNTHEDYTVTLEIRVESLGDSEYVEITEIEVSIGDLSAMETPLEKLYEGDSYTFTATFHPTEDNMWLTETEETRTLSIDINGYEYYYSIWWGLESWSLWFYETIAISVKATLPNVSVFLSSTEVKYGEEVNVTVTVTYPDGLPEEDALVSIYVDDTPVSVEYTGAGGIYTATIGTSLLTKGTHTVKVEVYVTPFSKIIKTYTITVKGLGILGTMTAGFAILIAISIVVIGLGVALGIKLGLRRKAKVAEGTS